MSLKVSELPCPHALVSDMKLKCPEKKKHLSSGEQPHLVEKSGIFNDICLRLKELC